MTNKEIKNGIDGLKFTMDMFLFDPMTGENKRPDCLNDMDKITYDACAVGIKALEKSDKYRWHDLRKNPEDLPPNEHEVDIAYIGYKGIKKTARAIYEDGTMHSEDSDFFCIELDEWCEYCEETDDYIIPKGWLEITHFAENMGIVDCEVIAWREIEEFRGDDDE